MFMGPTLDFRKFLPPQHPLLQLASVTDPAPMVPPSMAVTPPAPKIPEVLRTPGAEPGDVVPDPERTTPVVIPPGPTSRKVPEVLTTPGGDERTVPQPDSFKEELLKMIKDPKAQANLAQFVKGFGGAKAAPPPPPPMRIQLAGMGRPSQNLAGPGAAMMKGALPDPVDLRRKGGPPEQANYDILAARRARRRRDDD